MIILLRALWGGFSNWMLRGGGAESAFFHYKNISGMRYVHAAGFGLLYWFHTHILLLSILAMLGMVVGQAFGWGHYIAAMRGQDPKHSKQWGVARMSLRGLLWAFCLALPIAGYHFVTTYKMVWDHFVGDYNMITFLLFTFLSGVAQGPIYFIVIRAFKALGTTGNRFVNDWTTAEFIHGLAQWRAAFCL